MKNDQANDQDITASDKRSNADDTSQKQVNEVDYKDKYLRALADYQNLLKRVEKEKQDFVEYANARLIERMLDILDDFERAQATVEDTGIGLIHSKLVSMLKSEGVEEIKIQETDEFNPEYMECIEAEQDGKRIEVVRTGYTLKGKVLRVAQVKVLK